MIHRDGSLKEMIFHRIIQGRRVLVLGVDEVLSGCSMQKCVHERLFKVCVMPAFEYSVNIWGAGDFDSIL